MFTEHVRAVTDSFFSVRKVSLALAKNVVRTRRTSPDPSTESTHGAMTPHRRVAPAGKIRWVLVGPSVGGLPQLGNLCSYYGVVTGRPGARAQFDK